MIPEWVKEALPLISILLTLVVAPALRGTLRSGLATIEDIHTATKAQAEALSQEVEARAQLNARVAALELRMGQLPGAADVAALRVMMAELAGELKVTRADLSGVRELLNRVEDTTRTHGQVLSSAALSALSVRG